MSREKTEAELNAHKTTALDKLNKYLDGLISSEDTKLHGKADKLSYWMEDWTRFLSFETQFTPLSLRRYKRGEVIKVHLGFNVGSEEGGLHYAVVLDKNNAKSSPVVTIIPLTSVKHDTDTSNLKSGSLFLGNELFTNLSAKVSNTEKCLSDEVKVLKKTVETLISNASPEKDRVAFNELIQRIKDLENELITFGRMRAEVQKMKHGSIALVNQITTISKIRIYDPKTDHDILSGIKFSNEKLDLIDNEIKKRFTNL